LSKLIGPFWGLKGLAKTLFFFIALAGDIPRRWVIELLKSSTNASITSDRPSNRIKSKEGEEGSQDN